MLFVLAEDGTIVPEDIESESIETLSMRVKHAITLDHELYQDILIYKVNMKYHSSHYSNM